MPKIYFWISINQWRNIKHGCSNLRNINGEQGINSIQASFSKIVNVGAELQNSFKQSQSIYVFSFGLHFKC